jgi:hypothetical protein
MGIIKNPKINVEFLENAPQKVLNSYILLGVPREQVPE